MCKGWASSKGQSTGNTDTSSITASVSQELGVDMFKITTNLSCGRVAQQSRTVTSSEELKVSVTQQDEFSFQPLAWTQVFQWYVPLKGRILMLNSLVIMVDGSDAGGYTKEELEAAATAQFSGEKTRRLPINGQRIRIDFNNGSNLYCSSNVSGGGHRCFGEPIGSCTNQDSLRRDFRVRFIDEKFFELELSDGRVLYQSCNEYAGGNGLFCEHRNSHSNHDKCRRSWTFTREGNGCVLALRNGRTAYISSNVVDGGHGIFCINPGQATNTSDSRRRCFWTVV